MKLYNAARQCYAPVIKRKNKSSKTLNQYYPDSLDKDKLNDKTCYKHRLAHKPSELS